jgi:hypothetical protein
MYRIMGAPFPGKWEFLRHPWSKDMHDFTEEMAVGQKSAQMAYTETAMNKVFFHVDIRKESAIYVLPTEENAQKFSASRFDPALELSKHLAAIFSDVKNVTHKRAGTANLFIRGSVSRNKLVSDPVSLMIFDEVDEMHQENIPLAVERMSGQQFYQAFFLSTPTATNFGINKYFQRSTQDHWVFPCPHCSRHVELSYPDCLVITADTDTDPKLLDSYIICPECKHKLEHKDKTSFLPKGRWISSFSNRIIRGFYINQLYSSTVAPWKIAETAIKSISDPVEEQQLWNSKLGLPHTIKGANVTDAELEACTKNYKKYMSCDPNYLVTMGVDVGKWLHVEIDRWFFDHEVPASFDTGLSADAELLWQGKVKDFESLDILMRDFAVKSAVVDAEPETRKAMEFAQRFKPLVKLCDYFHKISTRQLVPREGDEDVILVNRTIWLDTSLGRFRSKKISIPIDTDLEYKEQVKVPARIYKKDKDGNPRGIYVSSDDDHFAHARNYSEIALPLAVCRIKNIDIRVLLG